MPPGTKQSIGYTSPLSLGHAIARPSICLSVLSLVPGYANATKELHRPRHAHPMDPLTRRNCHDGRRLRLLCRTPGLARCCSRPQCQGDGQLLLDAPRKARETIPELLTRTSCPCPKAWRTSQRVADSRCVGQKTISHDRRTGRGRLQADWNLRLARVIQFGL